MRLTASSFYGYYRPSACELRVWLRARGEPEKDPSPYELVLRKLGLRHEAEHLKTLGDVVDLHAGPGWFREYRTRRAIARGARVIYQGRLRARTTLAGVDCEIVGEPDYLIRDGDGYLIRDSKLNRRVEGHREIALQLGTYGWLYEQVIGRRPSGLQVHAGTGDILPLDYDGGAAALAGLEEIVRWRTAADEPYSPVGWSKCGACVFRARNWERAVAARDVALVPGVDQGLARFLHDEGVTTVDQLLERYDADSLAQVQRPRGSRLAVVGERGAASIMRLAQAMASGTEIAIAAPALPAGSNFVMFDLEGLPPQLDDVEKVYLWGVQVFGERPSEFFAATASFGVEGDWQGWRTFLTLCGQIFDRYGDIPFVHWATYEKTKLDLYVSRFGDPDGIAARVRTNLVDLLPITQASVALPLPSYSLKVVEKHVGFVRQLPDTGGDWAMARYIEATETHDERVRSEVMNEILAYNAEDLEATWAVFEWLRAQAAPGAIAS